MSEETRKPDANWKGLPVYRCRFCRLYERVGEANLAAVLEHERQAHAPAVRATGLVDEAGAPLMTTEPTEEES